MKFEENLYLIAGLGADARLFEQFIKFHPKAITIQWLSPLPQETLKEYAIRLAYTQIDTNKPFAVLGCSLGGIMATEINEHFNNCAFAFQVSSVKNNNEIPGYLYLFKLFPFSCLVKGRLLKKLSLAGKIILGLSTKVDYSLFNKMLHDQPNTFMTWAMKAVLQWPKQNNQKNIFAIHGNKDKVFPIGYKKNVDLLLPHAGHIAMYTHAHIIASFVKEQFCIFEKK